MSGSPQTASRKGTLQHLNVLKDYLNSIDLSRDDICLVGSALLADYGLRPNNDLDIAIDPFERSKINFEDAPDELEVAIEKYSWLGITDHDLIHDEYYHYQSQGFKIIRPEIELSYKHRRLWDKDENDIKLLEDRFLNADDYNWDWERFSYEYYPKKFSERGLPVSSQNKSPVARFEQKRSQDGFIKALYSTGEYIIDKAIKYNQRPESADSDSGLKTTRNQTLYFIVWPTASEFFDELVTHLDTELGVISTKSIELSGEMDQFVKDIYNSNAGSTERLIEYKSYKIRNNGTTVLLIETQCPVTPSGEFDEDFLSSFKDQVRKQYYPYLSDDSFHNIIHGPDTLDENKWIKRVLRSYIDNTV